MSYGRRSRFQGPDPVTSVPPGSRDRLAKAVIDEQDREIAQLQAEVERLRADAYANLANVTSIELPIPGDYTTEPPSNDELGPTCLFIAAGNRTLHGGCRCLKCWRGYLRKKPTA